MFKARPKRSVEIKAQIQALKKELNKIQLEEKSKEIPKEIWSELYKLHDEINSENSGSIQLKSVEVSFWFEIEKNKIYPHDVEILGDWQKIPEVSKKMKEIQFKVDSYLKRIKEVNKQYGVNIDPWSIYD